MTTTPTPTAPPDEVPTDPLAVLSLIFGILGLLLICPSALIVFFLCGAAVCALAAIVLGHVSRSRKGPNGKPASSGGLSLSGLILGYLTLLLIALLIAGVSYLASTMESDNEPERALNQQAQIAGLDLALVLQATKKCRAEAQPELGTTNAEIVTTLLGQNSAQRDFLELELLDLSFTVSPEGKLLDSWGQPLNFLIAPPDESAVVGGQTIDDSVAIWSNGPNKRNELGKGDDINSWEKPEN